MYNIINLIEILIHAYSNIIGSKRDIVSCILVPTYILCNEIKYLIYIPNYIPIIIIDYHY